MKTFKDFNLKPLSNVFVGDKVKIMKVLNKTIIIHAYKTDPSQYPKNKGGKVMTLQIENNGAKGIIFTGSEYLMQQIKQVPEDGFPFETTIIKNGEHFEFS